MPLRKMYLDSFVKRGELMQLIDSLYVLFSNILLATSKVRVLHNNCLLCSLVKTDESPGKSKYYSKLNAIAQGSDAE